VEKSVDEITRLLRKDDSVSLRVVEDREELINDACQNIEEKCLDLLIEEDRWGAREIRMLVSSTIIATKFERIADHANRVGRMASWASEDGIDIPPQLPEMAAVVHRMVQDVLLSFLTNDTNKAQEILQRDSQVNYLHDVLSKQLLSNLGEQEQEKAQMRAQFLFCARFLERMGDACSSIAKRIFFIVTGNRLRREPTASEKLI
jgi:phosphate transport system protein